MGTRLTSRICLLVVPLLVVCVLMVGGGTAYAGSWQGMLHLWPGPNTYDPYDDTRDICGWPTGYSGDGNGDGWPFGVSGRKDWDILQGDDSGSHLAIASWGNTFNVYMTDAYLAQRGDDNWANNPQNTYKRQITVIWKFPSQYGSGALSVEVWKVNDGAPDDCGPDKDYPYQIDTIADQVETFGVAIEGPTDWRADNDVKDGAGSTDPVGTYGTILRAVGYVINAGKMWVDSVDVYYSVWVP